MIFESPIVLALFQVSVAGLALLVAAFLISGSLKRVSAAGNIERLENVILEVCGDVT